MTHVLHATSDLNFALETVWNCRSRPFIARRVNSSAVDQVRGRSAPRLECQPRDRLTDIHPAVTLYRWKMEDMDNALRTDVTKA